MTLPHRCALAALSACLASSLTASAADRKIIALDKGWRFAKAGTESGQQAPQFSDAAWQKVDLPHTWNRIGGPQGQAYASDAYSGPAWYRLSFETPKAGEAERYFLQFDGVGTIADVWLNGHYLGKHEGAFARFRFDATGAMLRGKQNILAVKADNSIPAPGSTTASVIPLSGDFFKHGGIYRNVSLIVTSPQHIDLMDFGGPGVYASARDISSGKAKIDVRTRIANDLGEAAKLQLTVRVEDSSGKIVARRIQAVSASPRAVASVSTTLDIASPHLWNGTDDPYLYRVVVTLQRKNGSPLDESGQPLGLRTMTFDADKGFFLNGKHLFLRGVALHQDEGGKGWAMRCADQKRDFDLVEDVGANAVRLAHYQHDQCSYDEADRRGFAVWAEVPLVNEVSFDGTPASPALTTNARQQLTELIRQNYNHPSIVMWSVGNEVDLRAIAKNGPSKAGPLVRVLAELVRQEDSSRPSALADCCEQATAPNRDVLVGLTDAVGYNRYFGWYNGEFDDFGPFLDRAHAAHPRLPIGVSEYGAGAALSQHSDNPNGGLVNPHGRPHPEEYQNLYHEASWKQLAARPYLWGVFIWNMFDFATPGREEGDLIDINDKGLVTIDRAVRKDAFYFYRANWNTAPTLHLVGRRYTDRPYGVLDVEAYSNTPAASLVLNGKLVGTTSCTGSICLWKAVHLDAGNNVLKATAIGGGAPLSDTLQWHYGGNPGVVRIKAGDIVGMITSTGLRFGSDMYFDGGTARGTGLPDTRGHVTAAAAESSLYDSYREGAFSYHVPLPDGRYSVTLHFAEPVASKAGERVFDVRANGITVVRNFDVFVAAGGRHKGYTRSFHTKVTGGFLNLEFHAAKGQALLSACEIVAE